jgi:hypothetical protein
MSFPDLLAFEKEVLLGAHGALYKARCQLLACVGSFPSFENL